MLEWRKAGGQIIQDENEVRSEEVDTGRIGMSFKMFVSELKDKSEVD